MPQTLTVVKTSNETELFSKEETLVRLAQLAATIRKGIDKTVAALYKQHAALGDIGLVETAMKNRIGVICTLIRDLEEKTNRGDHANKEWVQTWMSPDASANLGAIRRNILGTSTTARDMMKNYHQHAGEMDAKQIAALAI